MSTIELRDVTRIFDKPGFGAGLGLSKGVVGSQADWAFAERANAHARSVRESALGRDGKIVALDHVSARFPDGQCVAVVGPSGCGKSTLLRVVAGLDTDYTGDVLYDGEDVRDVHVKDRYIGMVFQNYALYPHFEGKGNLGFFFKVRHKPDFEAQERIRVTSEMMGIDFKMLLDRKPGALSGGQQQRVAIARAIVRNPRLFLFDEPLSNLDAKLRAQTRVEIKRLISRFRITSIYVTHDQVEAIALGDLVAVMRDGKIEQMGPYQSLRDDPRTAFVAGFLGRPPMNLLAGVVDGGSLKMGDVTVPLPEGVKAQVRAGQPVTLGARPEAMRWRIQAEGPATPGVLRAMVETVEPDMAYRTQTIYARNDELFFAATGSLDDPVSVGDQVEVALPPPDALCFFDAQTGQRIPAHP